MNVKKIIALTCLLLPIALFQNCSDVATDTEFSSSAAPLDLSIDQSSQAVSVNSINRTNVTIEGSCNRDGQVIFSDDLGSTDCVDGVFSASLDLSHLEDGAHQIRAVFKDSFNSIPFDISLDLVVDTVPPVVSTTSLVANEFIFFDKNNIFTVTGTCNEINGLVTFSDGLGTAICDGVNFNAQLDVSNLSEGEHLISANITDSAGNVAESDAVSIIKGTPFISEWEITSDNLNLTIPLKPNHTYKFLVDWGDDTPSEIVTSHDDIHASHTYSTDGEYTVRIIGLCESFGSSNKSDPYTAQLLNVVELGHVGWKDLSNAFYNADKLTTVNGGNTSLVTNMDKMFAGADLATPDTSSWDTSNVTSMAQMFSGAKAAMPNTANWNTDNVTNMYQMFSKAFSATPETSNWNTGNVTTMSGMFLSAIKARPNTANWNTENVTNMSNMFAGAKEANPETSNWNTSKVTSMDQLFYRASLANPNVRNWDTSKVKNMRSIFRGASSADPDMSLWSFASATTMASIINGSNISNQNYSNFLINVHSQSLNLPTSIFSFSAQFKPEAAAARAGLINEGWGISDGGAE